MKIKHTHRESGNLCPNFFGYQTKVYRIKGSLKQGKFLVVDHLTARNYFIDYTAKRVYNCKCYAEIEIKCDCLWVPVVLNQQQNLKLFYLIRKANIDDKLLICGEVR